MEKKSWIIEVEQAPDGEYFIQLTEEMLEGSGFKIGDVLDWKDLGDGSFMLTKAEDKPQELVWVAVDTVSMFRMRYMVQVPASNPEWALDTVTCEEAKEFSQVHVGETIMSHRVVSEEEALKICDEDNDYLKSWSTEKKIDSLFTTWKEQQGEEK